MLYWDPNEILTLVSLFFCRINQSEPRNGYRLQEKGGIASFTDEA